MHEVSENVVEMVNRKRVRLPESRTEIAADGELAREVNLFMVQSVKSFIWPQTNNYAAT